MSGAGNQTQYKWTLGIRLLTHQIPRAAVRTTLTYQVHPRLQLGIEYNPRAHEVAPLMNLVIVKESERRPALMIGTSTDRIGTPKGQALFATVSKHLKQSTGLPIAPYAGAAFGTYEHRLRPIAGLTIFLGKGFSLIHCSAWAASAGETLTSNAPSGTPGAESSSMTPAMPRAASMSMMASLSCLALASMER